MMVVRKYPNNGLDEVRNGVRNRLEGRITWIMVAVAGKQYFLSLPSTLRRSILPLLLPFTHITYHEEGQSVNDVMELCSPDNDSTLLSTFIGSKGETQDC